jgi:hypothetical protein
MSEDLPAKRLTNYPNLDRWLESEKNRLKVPEFHCCLGPEGQFYVNNVSYGQRVKLDPSIMKEVKARFDSDEYGGDPVKVAIGVDYAYVTIGKNGDLCWDLKGHYSDLDKALCEATTGVKVSDFPGFDFACHVSEFQRLIKLPDNCSLAFQG